MKRLIVLTLFLCSITPLIALDLTPQIACQTESDADEILNQELTIVASFSNFIDSFIALLCEKTAQAKIILHQLIHSALEISQLLTGNKKSLTSDAAQNDNLFNIIDQQTLDKLSNLVTSKAHTITMIKGKQTNAALETKHKADVQKIINFFAGIMQNFFSIVQDPENKQNVSQGVIGMLGNIVAAGNTIIKDTQPANETATAEQVVDAMDENTKQQILNLIQARRQSIHIQA